MLGTDATGRIKVEYEQRVERSGLSSAIMLDLYIRNVSGNTLLLNFAGEEHQLKLGLTVKSGDVLLEELRLPQDGSPIFWGDGELLAYQLALKPQPGGTRTEISVGLLREGMYWLDDANPEGAGRSTFYAEVPCLTPRDRRVFELGGSLSAYRRRPELEYFVDFLDALPLTGKFPSLDGLEGQTRNERSRLDGRLNAPSRTGNPLLTRFYDHANAVAPLLASAQRHRRGSNMLGFWRFLQRNLPEPDAKRRFTTDQFIAYLSEDVTDMWIADAPITRLSLYAMFEENYKLELTKNIGNFYYWIVTSFLLPRNLPETFIDTDVKSFFQASVGDEGRVDFGCVNAFISRQLVMSQEDRAHFRLSTAPGALAWSFKKVFENAKHPILSALTRNVLSDFWLSPVVPNGNSRLALACWYYFCETEEANCGDPFRAPDVSSWFLSSDIGAKLLRSYDLLEAHAAASLAQTGNERAATEHDVTVCGLVDSQTGIGRVHLTVVADLRGAGMDVRELDSRSSANMDGLGPARSVIYTCSVDRVPFAIASTHGATIARGAQLAYCLWELEVVPEAHELTLELMDGIVVPSKFLQTVYSRGYEKPVIYVRPRIEVPDVEARKYNRFTFLISFDADSCIERKNPLATVLAFQSAFSKSDEDVQLIVKSTRPTRRHWGDPFGQWDQIVRAAAADPRIKIVVGSLEYRQYMSMVKGANCVVSTHRSEGLGYLPANALKYGVPLIVTDYSATTEFCTEETAYPVSWTRREVQDGEYLYPVKNAWWADVDHEHLVAQMRAVRENYDVAKARAAAGKDLLDRNYSAECSRSDLVEAVRGFW
jgi:glycosyltransferase involved in cell wall biosynthesis